MLGVFTIDIVRRQTSFRSLCVGESAHSETLVKRLHLPFVLLGGCRGDRPWSNGRHSVDRFRARLVRLNPRVKVRAASEPAPFDPSRRKRSGATRAPHRAFACRNCADHIHPIVDVVPSRATNQLAQVRRECFREYLQRVGRFEGAASFDHSPFTNLSLYGVASVAPESSRVSMVRFGQPSGGPMKPEIFTFTRDELYERIWSEPLQKFAATLGLSDVAVAKTCAKLNIPRPPRGYWARRAAGQKVRRRPLPPAKHDTPTEARFQVWPEPAPDVVDEPVRNALAREERPEARIEVAEKLEEPHPLVRLTVDALRKTKPASDGRSERNDRRCLSLHVSPESLPRALRIMDALLKALEARGLPVEVTPPDDVQVWTPSATVETVRMPITRVKIEGEWIPFCVEELVDITDLAKVDPSKYHPDRYVHRANGRLRIRIRNEIYSYRGCSPAQRSWADGSVRRVEHCLNAFIVALYAASASMKKSRIEAERRRLEHEEQQRRYQEQERARKEDEERRKQITDDIGNWRLARDVRALAAEARQIVAAAHCEITPDGEIDVWLRWCESYADSIDPLEPLRRAVAERANEHVENCANCQKQKEAETISSGTEESK